MVPVDGPVASMQHTRPLGAQESIFHQMHGLKAFIPLQVLHIKGAVDPDRVRQGLAWLQRQHPLLRAHIRYGSFALLGVPPFLVRRPFFETKGTTAIPFEVVDGNWEDILARELDTRLPKNRTPRMRVTLVRDPADVARSHIVILADHATIDAQSINMLSRELLEYLADPTAMEATPPTLTELPPPLEERLGKKPHSGTRKFQYPLRIPLRPVEPDVVRRSRVLGKHIDAGTAAALKSIARDRGTTLHGVVAASFLQALRRMFGIADLTCLSTIDLRRLCRPPLPKDTFGCYVDILRTRIAIADDLWTTARDVSFKLIAALAKDQAMASILNAPTFRRYASQAIPTMTHRLRIDSLCVTTAGESGLKRTYGNRTLEDVTMAVSIDLYGPTLMVIASEREGRLDLCINYSARVIAPADVTTIADDAVATLNAAVGALQTTAAF